MPKRRVPRHAVTQPLDQSYCLIPLTQGKNALVDTEDFERLSMFNWCYSNGYATRRTKAGIVRMHREVLEAPSTYEVDHKSHDTLDNRKQNLRIATHGQNMFNRRKQVGNTSGFKGIWWEKNLRKWRASISIGNRTRHIGSFHTAIEAAQAYDDAAKIQYGEFAKLNFA